MYFLTGFQIISTACSFFPGFRAVDIISDVNILSVEVLIFQGEKRWGFFLQDWRSGFLCKYSQSLVYRENNSFSVPEINVS